MSYTAFIQVVSWLVTAVWIDRTSELPVHAAVTVEPADKSEVGATIPAAGSYWAEIVSVPEVAETRCSEGHHLPPHPKLDLDCTLDSEPYP